MRRRTRHPRLHSAASYAGARTPLRDSADSGSYAGFISTRELRMGKYLIAWILGVPAIVLVVAYMLFN